MNFRIESKLFGTLNINVDIEDYEEEMWEDIGDYLCVNIFVHPDDEDKPLDERRHLAGVWSMKKEFSKYHGRFLYNYGEELEAIDEDNVSKKL